jgi:hypothetical protein
LTDAYASVVTAASTFVNKNVSLGNIIDYAIKHSPVNFSNSKTFIGKCDVIIGYAIGLSVETTATFGNCQLLPVEG